MSAPPTDSYLFLKSLHLVGMVIFVGNIVVTAWWKGMADRTRDPKIVAFAQRQVSLTDWVFTFGGVVLVTVSGIGNAYLHDIPMTAPWIALGTALLAASGLIWIAAAEGGDHLFRDGPPQFTPRHDVGPVVNAGHKATLTRRPHCAN